MANGDVDVKVRFSSFLPGAGYDASGRAVQGKTNIRGVITTTYLRGGVSLSAVDVGLETIDDLALTLPEPCSSNDPAQGYRDARYSKSAAQFYLTVGELGNNTDTVELPSGTVVDVAFDAFGDSAHNAELL